MRKFALLFYLSGIFLGLALGIGIVEYANYKTYVSVDDSLEVILVLAVLGAGINMYAGHLMNRYKELHTVEEQDYDDWYA